MNREHWKAMLPFITAFANGGATDAEYRMLQLGEVVQEGDEWRCGERWLTVVDTIGKSLHDKNDIGNFRRPIEPDVDNLRRQLSELHAALVEARGERDRVRAQRDEARASLDRRPKLEAAASTVARVLATGQTEVIDFDGGKVHIMRDDESRLMNGLLSVMEKAVDGEPQKFTTKAGFEFVVASAIQFDEMKAMRKKLQEAWDQVSELQIQLNSDGVYKRSLYKANAELSVEVDRLRNEIRLREQVAPLPWQVDELRAVVPGARVWVAASSDGGKSGHASAIPNTADQSSGDVLDRIIKSRGVEIRDGIVDLDAHAAAHQTAEASPRERIVATLACVLVASGSEFDAKAVVRMADELIKEMAK